MTSAIPGCAQEQAPARAPHVSAEEKLLVSSWTINLKTSPAAERTQGFEEGPFQLFRRVQALLNQHNIVFSPLLFSLFI